jgi:nucleotide-binding universal stress UspA family protein
MKRVPIERILCPVDSSEFSVLAYEYASSLARHYGAVLFAQYVVETWRHPCATFAPDVDEYDQSCKTLFTAGQERLRVFVNEHRQSGVLPPMRDMRRRGRRLHFFPFAEKHAANLILMGAHGLRGFDRLTLGSVTEKVLRESLGLNSR